MSYTLFYEHGTLYDALWIVRNSDCHRVAVRGVPGYTTDGYDAADALHALLDRFDPPSVSVLMSGDIYHINIKNPRSKPTIDACDWVFQELCK